MFCFHCSDVVHFYLFIYYLFIYLFIYVLLIYLLGFWLKNEHFYLKTEDKNNLSSDF